MQNELDRETATETLIQQIKSMSDRIANLIEIANKCVQDDIKIPDIFSGSRDFGYNQDFVRVIKLAGNNDNENYTKESHVALLHFKNVYNHSSKGAITHVGFYTSNNKCLVFDSDGFHRVMTNDGKVFNDRLDFKNSFYYNWLVKFMYEFPRLEKAFLKWYDSLTNGVMKEKHATINLSLTFNSAFSEQEIMNLIYENADRLGIEQFKVGCYQCRER